MKIFRYAISIAAIILFFVLIFKQNTTVQSYIGGDFVIPSSNGEYRLADNRGKVVILYFGYRFCPDICPTTLSTLSSIYKKLGTSEQKKLQVVFISVDTERDTIESLSEYVGFFNENFIGATDTAENIAKLANMYGVKYKKFYPEGRDEEYYSVDHSAEAFIIGKDGILLDIIPHQEDFDLSMQKILTAIKEKK